MNWYVLFTRTGSERNVEQLIRNNFDTNVLMPFIPMLETLFKISGRVKKEVKPLFPGYVFIESEEPAIEIIKMTRNIVYFSKDIYRFLHYESKTDIAMREHERNMLLKLFNDERYVEPSTGIIVGDRVYVKEGPLKGLESTIRRIDRHKRRATIELEFMGSVRQINVALEIIEKI